MSKVPAPKFRLNAKKVFLTYAKCNVDLNDILKVAEEWGKVEYAVICEENHKDGTPHRHAAILYAQPIDIKRADALDVNGFHGNYQAAKQFDAVVEYVKKAGRFIEKGEYHTKKERQKISRAEKNKILLQQPIWKSVECGDISLMHAETLRKGIAAFNKSKYPEINEFDDDKVCYWIYGDPGTGKSAWVRQVFGYSLYIKVPEKWWDNYQGEECVLLEDLDQSYAKSLVQHIKIWADKYHFSQEEKGGRVNLTYRRFCITSNFLPFELWKDPMLHEAVSRRFIFLKTKISEQNPGFYVEAEPFYYNPKL